MALTQHLSAGHWHSHIHRHAACACVRDWLTNRQSLTARLVDRCAQFQVQRLHQRTSRCLQDEFSVLDLSMRCQVTERDVLLRCNGVPVVYAHTILPRSANASQWPLFGALGNTSLGATLFGDPLVERGALQYSLLRPSHPLMRRIRAIKAVDSPELRLSARRSLFTRRSSSLLVTEVFLPALYALGDRHCGLSSSL